MPDDVPDGLAGVPARLRAPLAGCRDGTLPPLVAAMRLLVEAVDPDEPARAVRATLERPAGEGGAQRLRALLAVLEAKPDAWATVKAVLGAVDHRAPPDAGPGHWAALFDRAARISPEASVALYSLGDPDLLRAATAEIVHRLREWGLVGPDRAVLDIGCGIGRLEEALSPEVGRITGIDVSAEMVALAQRRCSALRNVAFAPATGSDLSGFPDASFDLVLAVDVFPYLVEAGDLAARHVQEAARVLRSGGALLVLNWSYRGNLERDRAGAAAYAAASGLAVVRNGTRPFERWDGAAFEMQQPAPPA